MIKRKTKIITIVALVIAIFGMTLGFAAFSTTLNISTSATVAPNSEDFKINFIGIDGDNIVKVVDATIKTENAMISDDGQSITGINANLGKPGDYVVYKVYIENNSDYDAYFHGILIDNVEGHSSIRKCTPVGDTNLDLLNAVCPKIGFQFSLQGDDGSSLYVNGVENKNYYMKKGSRHLLAIRYIYVPDAGYVDGPFNVEYGKINFSYSTVPRNN